MVVNTIVTFASGLVRSGSSSTSELLSTKLKLVRYSHRFPLIPFFQLYIYLCIYIYTHNFSISFPTYSMYSLPLNPYEIFYLSKLSKAYLFITIDCKERVFHSLFFEFEEKVTHRCSRGGTGKGSPRRRRERVGSKHRADSHDARTDWFAGRA